MSDSELGLSINKAYADKYNTWRRKEELQKLKDRHGDVDAFSDGSGESSSSETEDEDAEALTPKVETSWLKALAALKARDPKIYNRETIFFEPEEDTTVSRKKKKQDTKPFTIKDYERKLILEKEGRYVDEDDESSELQVAPRKVKGYYEEQEDLRRSINAAAQDQDSSSDGDLLTTRKKTAAEEEEEEAEYHKWLMGQKSSLPKEEAEELEPLRQHYEKAKSDQGEKYLWDYILNKRYVTQGEEEIPTYDDIVKDDVDLSEEEDILEKQETFERKYNFRFEEPDPEFIKNYPRTIDDSVRRKDTRRAEKRHENKERKELEKDQRRQELKRLKNLKRKELLDKINRLKSVSGRSQLTVSERELDEDFDPAKHDEQMRANFGADYYGECDEEEKPTFEYDPELDGEDWDAWVGPSSAPTQQRQNPLSGEDPEEPFCHEQPFNMDADFDPDQDAGPSKKKRRGRGRKFADMLSTDKPPFDPNDKTFEEYVNDYYKFDYEDIVGDIPVRFKYRTVIANDFGLSMDEVLAAREKELNAWCSLKKAVQCRTEEEELADKRVFAKKARNVEKKKRIMPSLVPLLGDSKTHTPAEHGKMLAASNHADEDVKMSPGDGVSEETKKKKRKKKKDRRVQLHSEKTDAAEGPAVLCSSADAAPKAQNKVDSNGEVTKKVNGGDTVMSEAKKKPKKRKFTPETISDERLKAYGFNPKKFKYLAKTKSQHA